MTSTGTFTAAGVGKPTSRVLAPPGGSSNISFGGYGTDEPKKTSQKPEAQRHEPVGQNQQDLYNPNPPQAIRPAEDSYASLFGEVEHIEVSGNQPRGKRRYPDRSDMGNNPVTGAEPVAEGAAHNEGGAKGRNAKPPKLDPASMPAAGGRVENKAAMKRQPPGGKDSGIFN
ncbi:jupiter microtubule associated homolog 1-like isoform X1 [Asterias rubens]|uniref:jupiter microtubule associated homolog 1-like isoform X1 n=1 Tax=Asterias rubens TaxID=7604 RepID=UPI001455065A|nr:jupiter microtubule associated homolog 1-like isoform X1 [Asterias rubens]